MPFPRTWLPRISAILTAIEAWPTKEFDRGAVAQIFTLKRRAALSLMKEIGPVRLRTGRWMIPRERLLSFLLSQAKEAEIELARKEHYTQSLLAADASLLRRPSILLKPRKLSAEQREVYAAGLPESVTLCALSPPSVNANKHALRNSQVLIAAPFYCLFGAPIQNSRLPIEETSHGLRRHVPHAGNFGNGVVRFKGDGMKIFTLNRPSLTW